MTSFKYIVITFFMCNESIEMGHHSSSIVVCFFFQELHTYVVHTYLNVGGGLAVNWRQMVKPTGHQTSHVEVIVVSCKNGLRRRRRIKKCYTGIWCGFVCYYDMAMIMWQIITNILSLKFFFFEPFQMIPGLGLGPSEKSSMKTYPQFIYFK